MLFTHVTHTNRKLYLIGRHSLFDTFYDSPIVTLPRALEKIIRKDCKKKKCLKLDNFRI